MAAPSRMAASVAGTLAAWAVMLLAALPARADVARQLADILSDETAREALIARLLAEAEAAPPAPPAPLSETWPARLAEATREAAEGVSAVAGALWGALGELGALATGEVPVDWGLVTAAASALGVAIAVAVTVLLLGRAALAPLRARLEARGAGAGPLLVSGLALVWLTLEMIPVALAWGAGHAAALAWGQEGAAAGRMDLRQGLFLNAFLVVETGRALLRALLAPGRPGLRALPMGEETAHYWHIWTMRLGVLLGYGGLLVVPVAADTLGAAVGQSLGVLLALVALLAALLLIGQNRVQVAAALAMPAGREGAGPGARALSAFGAFWHWLAMGWVLALFVLWLLRPAEAVGFMLAATLQSALSVALGALVMATLARAIRGGLSVPSGVAEALPLLEERLNAFVPALLRGVRALVVLAVLGGIAQAWGLLDVLGWLASEAGRAVLARLVTAALVLGMAGLAWLALTSFVEYRLTPRGGRSVTARERTLLSLFRNAATIGIAVVALMLALSELGVNIAPLLAGAGVVGLAIGFGAQRLVQDIITGAFIQFENAMNEGDVVTAAGVTGVVEKLTVRSVSLRDLAGTYHVIPFSSVDRVSNFVRGFSFHVAEVGVSYRENVAEVKLLMQEAFDRLVAGEHGISIVGPFEMHGVAALGDSSVVVRGRIRTLPGAHWAVGRAYNEIVKSVLDEAGVEIAFPHLTVYMGEGKDGTAPPLHLRRAGEDAKGGEGSPPPETPSTQ